MDAYYKNLIGGTIQYDERGNISNYDQIQDAMFAKYNQMADRYDEDSEEWQIFEKKYEQLEKYIEQCPLKKHQKIKLEHVQNK